MNEILDSLHTDIGYRLMTKRQLPKVYARIALDHHAERFDEGDPLLIIIRLMDVLCRKLGVGQAADPEIELAATPEAQVLGLKDIKLAELEQKTATRCCRPRRQGARAAHSRRPISTATKSPSPPPIQSPAVSGSRSKVAV
ncbi:hypothetical protein [Allochromatium tepidum]|uniref:Uncharacterized protein n=1 Tax=Allochromatium tepidum TaxID=553982 RepID=A0ABM7QI47_9GAMM|nr:hypothetical protein [Allochromatium tepidum]BCU05437.1 hypothetical protein Atep_01140 [Allochromatium tepidum]